jgi:hypothetical protein
MLGERKPSFSHFDENGLVGGRAGGLRQSNAVGSVDAYLDQGEQVRFHFPGIWGLTELFA